MFDGKKERIIQEFVPGKQVTLAHVIPHPVKKSCMQKWDLSMPAVPSGSLRSHRSEAAIIAADVASKAAGIKIGFVDRFNGSLIITGEVSEVEAALQDVMKVLCDVMGFAPAPVTRS